MTQPHFRPGFRVSTMDVFILIGGAALAGLAMSIDGWLATAIVFVVLHFFLFCNVLRMARVLELTWAGVFVGVATASIVGQFFGWPVVFAAASVLTIALATIQLRNPSYHGAGWQRINPTLPEWWRVRSGASRVEER
jgi:hypothetical protein